MQSDIFFQFKCDFDYSKLHTWFLAHKRDLPWRLRSDPYAIWISEVMLQQTQVATVIPYFNNWMELFPTINVLAKTPLESVIKAWEGLGYYSRARSLHAGAKFLVDNFGGVLPSTKDELSQIKGLGPYTIGAILSFAFHQKIAAVDGNVMRVLARYFKIEEDISKSSTQKRFREIANSILPEEESWITNEALIELGATICKRKPNCGICPLNGSCKSYRDNVTDQLPIKSKKITVTHLFRTAVIIRHGDAVLVHKRKKGEIMSDLYEFPYFETTLTGLNINEIEEKVLIEFGVNGKVSQKLLDVKHTFTRFRVQLTPIILQTEVYVAVPSCEWKKLSEIKSLAFSSGHRKIVAQL